LFRKKARGGEETKFGKGKEGRVFIYFRVAEKSRKLKKGEGGEGGN